MWLVLSLIGLHVADVLELEHCMKVKVKNCMANLDGLAAWEVYEQIPEDAGEDWQPVFRTILHCFCKTLQYKEATTVFQRMPIRDTIAYNMILQMLSKLRYTFQFERYLQQMDEEQVPRNWVTSTAILGMFKNDSGEWQRALDVLDKLKSPEHAEDREEFGLEVPYLLTMTTCARAREKEKVFELLEELKSNPSVQPQRSHYNPLIIACGNDADAARKVLEQMKAEGFRPTVIDYRALMTTCRDDCQAQRRVYEEMLEEYPHDPKEEALAVLLKTAVFNEDSSALEWTLEEMDRSGCSINSSRAQGVPSLRRAISEYQRSRVEPAAEAEAAAEAAVTAELPEGWQSAIDPKSQMPYYWHVNDPANTTTWERPSCWPKRGASLTENPSAGRV